jgi:hypothetical protein
MSDRVKCIDARPEGPNGTGLIAGQIYTVKRRFVGPEDSDDNIAGMENVAGIVLIEVRGKFRADRFERVSE